MPKISGSSIGEYGSASSLSMITRMLDDNEDTAHTMRDALELTCAFTPTMPTERIVQAAPGVPSPKVRNASR